MKRRIAQFSTGNVGRHALRSIIRRSDLELAGVHAHGSAKVGHDAAELCGLSEATGVIATDDVQALVDLAPDCVVYTTQAESRPHDALAEVTAFLEAGTNIVSNSFVWLVDPPHAEGWLREPIEAACAVGNSTMYVNGIDPGFSPDLLPLAALSLTERADTITVQEICDCLDHNEAGVIATAAKAVNAIEVVCEARPGLITLRDLPISQVRNLMA